MEYLYKNNIINEEKWGIMGSNSTKNLFITNSKLNRIDAHRGTRNLYVADTTIGVGNIKLSSVSINDEIENNRFDYTADFVFEEGDSTVVTIDLEPLYVGTNLSWTSKTVDLGNGNKTINFSV